MKKLLLFLSLITYSYGIGDCTAVCDTGTDWTYSSATAPEEYLKSGSTPDNSWSCAGTTYSKYYSNTETYNSGGYVKYDQIITTYTCQTPLDCTAPEEPSIDENGGHICIVPPEPTSCEYPYVLTDVNGTNQCLLPPNTNPDGTCEYGYAKDTSNQCFLDGDGDGVPDKEDDYPTDPTRSDDGSDGKNDDTGEDCSAYCGISHWQDCVDTTSISSSRTPIAEVGYIDCTDCVFRIDDQFGLTCAEFEGQQTSPDIPEDCSIEPSFGGYTNGTITRNQTECRIIQNSHGGGNSYALPNCSQGSVACYYASLSVEDDSNNTVPDNPTDTNGTSSDTATLVESVDAVRNSVDNVNDSVKNVVNEVTHATDAIKNNTEVLKGTLNDNFDGLKTVNSKGFGDVEKSIKEGTNTLGNKIDGMNDNIGTKLNGIKDAINDKEEYPMESDGLLTYDDIEVDSDLNSYSTEATTGLNGLIAEHTTDLFSLYSISLPISPSCGCTNPSYNFSFNNLGLNISKSGSIEICNPLQQILDITRPILWFAFLLGMLFAYFRGGN